MPAVKIVAHAPVENRCAELNLNPSLLSLADVATLLGIKERSVRDYVANGRLQATRVGKRTFVTNATSVNNFLLWERPKFGPKTDDEGKAINEYRPRKKPAPSRSKKSSAKAPRKSTASRKRPRREP